MRQASADTAPDRIQGRQRRMSAEKRRTAILAAAETAFGDNPFHETSLDGVAEVAGVSKALIYEHFASKRELYRALLASRADELLARVGTAASPDHGREARLRAGIEAFIDFVREHPGAARLLFHNPGDQDVIGELDRLRDEAAAMIASLMSEEMPPERPGSPVARERAVAMLSHQLIGSLQSLAVWWDANPETPREEIFQMAMEFTWLGLDRLSLGETWTMGS